MSGLNDVEAMEIIGLVLQDGGAEILAKLRTTIKLTVQIDQRFVVCSCTPVAWIKDGHVWSHKEPPPYLDWEPLYRTYKKEGA